MDHGDTRRMALALWSAMGAGFVLGFASRVCAFAYLIVVMVPKSSWWELIPVTLAAPVFGVLAGGFEGLALLRVVEAYQFRKGWFRCATCGDRLKAMSGKCSCYRRPKSAAH